MGFCGGRGDVGAGGCTACEECDKLPLCGCAEAKTFRLSVSVLSASIPSLSSPNLLLRQRPKVEIFLGNERRETSFASYSADPWEQMGSCPSASSSAGPEADRPWRFGDTVLLTASREDVLGPGIVLRLCAQSDLRFGPLQLALARGRVLGQCTLDLRYRVLPACVIARHCDMVGHELLDGESGMVWESAVVVVPLAQRSGAKPEAHVGLSFGISVDPAAVMRDADQSLNPLPARLRVPASCGPTSAEEHRGGGKSVPQPTSEARDLDSTTPEAPSIFGRVRSFEREKRTKAGGGKSPGRRVRWDSAVVEKETGL